VMYFMADNGICNHPNFSS